MKIVQDAFVDYGKIEFCCSDRTCKAAILVGIVIMNYVRLKLVIKQNAEIEVDMALMGFTKETMQIFKVIFDKNINLSLKLNHRIIKNYKNSELF